QKKGVKITQIGGGNNENLRLLKDNNINVIENFALKKFSFKTTKKLRAFIKGNKFDIVHLFISKDIKIAIPAVYNLPIKVVAYFGSASVHWYDPTAYLGVLNPRINAIICNSQFVYNHMVKQLFGNQKQKAVKIYKGYGEDWFNEVKPFNFEGLNISEKAIKIAIVGRNTKVKGFSYFMEAAAKMYKYKNVHFIVIGRDTDNAAMQLLKKEAKNSENIHLLGHRTDVVSILKSIDIYTQTSLSEGFGRAISEAMSVEKPIVMTNAGGCTELIETNKSGLVVPKKNAEAIANAWKKLIDDEHFRLQMGEHAQQRMFKKFNIKNTINKTQNLYLELVNS
ncbi:MAG TPA: glycosyltransferase family 4 protein, partial [Flavobacteriaceae bacterium]|nr:glycosyltransferase family 4 protein [Flavobacteriaceae bacterium]